MRLSLLRGRRLKKLCGLFNAIPSPISRPSRSLQFSSSVTTSLADPACARARRTPDIPRSPDRQVAPFEQLAALFRRGGTVRAINHPPIQVWRQQLCKLVHVLTYEGATPEAHPWCMRRKDVRGVDRLE